MIISHKHKFIFIKTVKTAGTSVEVELNRILAPDDVATPIFPPVEGHEPMNYSWYKWGFLKRQYYNHMPALEVREAIGVAKFSDYFVFCVEREPVEKCISHYSMLRNSPDHQERLKSLTVDDYINTGRFPIDVPKYTDGDGKLMVDRILRYENLDRELQEVGKMLGFKISLRTRVKSGFREELELTTTQKDRIYQAFEESNKYTGYSRHISAK
jgi:hypothetical protein